MAAFASYSVTASANVSIRGVSVAENCPAANINDAIRGLAAEGKELANIVAGINVSSYMGKAGGTFTGQIFRSGSGGYLYNANSAQVGGAVYVLPTGTPLPSSPAEGTFVFFY